MRIYSMSATFGKLEHEKLVLQPGLNIMEAPNEWGKSTWCAFLIAMLYGIETRLHTTKSVLVDKERYAPWSGCPMSGSMELNWQGRDITIQRHTKGRVPFGEFRAFETHTGLAIPELTAANCGQMLLGVEKSVFQKAGFIRFGDMPVTDDENLRRRLNALVSTGDESGTAELLGQKLRELKNRCGANRTRGLLPQAREECAEAERKLEKLRELRQRTGDLTRRQADLERYQAALDNHRKALRYADHLKAREKLADAQTALQAASAAEAEAAFACAGIPTPEEMETNSARLRQLRTRQDELHTQLRQLPPPPEGRTLTEASWEEAQDDLRRFRIAGIQRNVLLILGLAVLAAGCIGAYLLQAPLRYWAMAMAAVSVLLLVLAVWQDVRRGRVRKKYPLLPPEKWVDAAQSSGSVRVLRAEYSRKREMLESQLQVLEQEQEALTKGCSVSEYEQQLRQQRLLWQRLEQARREHCSARMLAQTLHDACKTVEEPAMPDHLTFSAEETQEQMTQCARQLPMIHQMLGICQAQMEALGQEEALRQEADSLRRRVAALEETLAAVELAQATLASATEQLQSRFAPKIVKRAKELFRRFTGDRYQRITLEADLRLNAAAEGEDILRSALWRSEGTVDQLYLALRLAVASELTPGAPLILDDALVRFDDARHREAMKILAEEAENKQILLFTCQSRENTAIGK